MKIWNEDIFSPLIQKKTTCNNSHTAKYSSSSQCRVDRRLNSSIHWLILEQRLSSLAYITGGLVWFGLVPLNQYWCLANMEQFICFLDNIFGTACHCIPPKAERKRLVQSQPADLVSKAGLKFTASQFLALTTPLNWLCMPQWLV